MLSAEIASLYFGELAGKANQQQKWLTWGTLISSSGAAALFLTSLPPGYTVVRPLLALIAAGLSLASLVRQNQKVSTDASELHVRWNRIAMELERIWEDPYAEEALAALERIEDKIAEVSKAGVVFPYDKKAMSRWQDYVESRRLTENMSLQT